MSDHARAEDIVQDVFMSALRSLRSSDREVAFKPWVYEIAKNACIDQLRKTRRASEVSIDSEDFSPVDEGRMSANVATTDAAYSAREDLDDLRMAFNDLPDGPAGGAGQPRARGPLLRQDLESHGPLALGGREHALPRPPHAARTATTTSRPASAASACRP